MSRPSAIAVARRLILAAVSICAATAGSSSAAAAAATPQLLPYTITTVAGGAASSPAVGAICATGSTRVSTDAYGDGCLATQVSITTPRASAVDSQNNLYIVDGANNLIRRVDVRTGVITTAVGGASATPASGAACASGSTLTSTSAYGDGCLATQVKLAAPEGITFDGAGNLWFTDYTLGSVRKVSKATGIITTVVNTAGTLGYMAGSVANPGVVVPAAQGMLVHPYGLAFDRQGNLYIADNYNSVVDVVNLGASTATIAGTISVPAGAIYTIAGAGCGFGPSTSGCTSYGKTGNGGPSTAATLDSPYQVAIDNSGNIYIADEYPYDVRVINGSTGILTTFANGAFTKSATIVRGPAVSTSLASTFGVATDSLGNVYIGVYDSTTSSSYVDRVDIATGIIYPIAGQSVTSVQTAGAASASATYCAAKTNAIGDGCPGTSATLYKPYQPTLDAAGNVYIADQGNGLIRKLSLGTQFPATAGSAKQSVAVHFGAGDTPASSAPYAIASGSADFTIGAAACAAVNSDNTQDCILPLTFTPSAPGFRFGQLTVKSTLGSTVTFSLGGIGLVPALAVDPGTQATLSSTGLAAVSGLALDSAGNTYAALPNATSGAVVKLTAAGVSSTVGTLANASAVAVDSLGNVYAALSTGTVVEVPVSGAQITLATGFTKLSGIAVDTYGNVFVSDQTANQVTEILVGTLAQVVVGTGLGAPGGLAVDASGNIFVASAIGNSVVEIPAVLGPTTSFGSGLTSPTAVALDAAGSLYVADSRNGRIVFIPNENGTPNTADQLTIVTGLTSPVGVAVSSQGNVSVADNSTSTIYTFNRNSASIAFGSDPIGFQVTRTADMVNAGNQAVIFTTPYTVASGSNTGDFSLTPTTLTGGTSFAAGFGLPLTAGFKPTATGARSATYTLAATNVAAQPKILLSGTGTAPVNASTTTINATPTTGTYGQTVTISVAVATGSGNPTATGSVTVNVDTNTYPVTLTSGAGSFSLPTLNAGTHTVTASYQGDTLSSPSTATAVTITLAKAPLTVVVNNASRAYYTLNPTFTGAFSGVVNNDQIGITYSTTAVTSSALGTYPITATATGTAAVNYALSVTPGVLTVTKGTTTTTVSASSTAVSASTAVILTATVTPPVGTQTGGVPTGTVTFFNNGAQIGTPVTLSAARTATYTTTFAVVGQSTNNVITAIYAGDTNFTTSTSSPLTVVSSLPGFSFVGSASALTVAQGQYGLVTFTVTPTFGYNGAISFACTGLISTVGCTFSPATIAADGKNTANLVALTITTQQPTQSLLFNPGTPNRMKAVALAGIPAMALLFGLAGRRRKSLRGFRALMMLGLCVLGLGISGCGKGATVVGTAKGLDTITVIATGTPGTGTTTNITQQFTVALTIK